MKVNEMVLGRPAMEKIANMEISAGVSLEFANFLKSILIETQDFETKRAELFSKYGVEEEEGESEQKNIRILPENENKFNTAIKIILDRDVDIEPFNLASLGIEIPPAELVNALPLFK